MGFHMLNNDRIPIVEGRDTLWLVGVENWGNPPFPRYGKLDVAIDSLPGQACIILLSHDPSHWRGEVLQVPRIALTLSGHTHAMQFGIKIGKTNGVRHNIFIRNTTDYTGIKSIFICQSRTRLSWVSR